MTTSIISARAPGPWLRKASRESSAQSLAEGQVLPFLCRKPACDDCNGGGPSIRMAFAGHVVVDGPDSDSGACIEIGYAKGLGKRIVGVRTDFRGSQEHGLNLMVSRICSHVVTAPSTTTTLHQLAQEIVKVLMDVRANHRPSAQFARRTETIHTL